MSIVVRWVKMGESNRNTDSPRHSGMQVSPEEYGTYCAILSSMGFAAAVYYLFLSDGVWT